MMNRHGLVAGATGTGKTKTLQLLAGQLSKVPVFVLDVKGDLTGLAAPAMRRTKQVVERVESPWPFEASGHLVEFLSLSASFVRRCAPPSASFGPCSSARSLTSTRPRSILALVFKYCDDNDLPLLDLKDLATTLKFSPPTRASRSLRSTAGCRAHRLACCSARWSSSSRRARMFFGELEFDVADLRRSRRRTARA